ncbi:hypothetical protein N7535_007467 [Penicillium sp. DV-2018c]|nr:hypothetical protein N7461_003494 [Penicillium sp. DV-2018c]KAJ5565829.1 hypothetical protein N7535_007467 [Penicillium sp. DV-2018c]
MAKRPGSLIVKILQKADAMVCDGLDLTFQWHSTTEECEGRVAAKQAAHSIGNMHQHHAPPEWASQRLKSTAWQKPVKH